VTTDVDQIQRLLEGKSRVRAYSGAFAGMDGLAVNVDLESSRLRGIKSMTSYRPSMGEQVWVLFVDSVPWMIGPTVSPPGRGKISSLSAETAVVTTDIGDVTATRGAGQTLAVGQDVKLYWQDGPHILGGFATTPPSPPPVPDPPAPPAPTRHVDVFTAVDAGSWSASYGWQQQQVWASNSLLGAWFYGSKIRDTLAGASIERIEIWSTLLQIQGSAPVFATHPHPGKPGGAPALANSTPLGAVSGVWLELPLAFGQYLAGNIGGIGLNHGGYNKFRSLAQDPQSGALRITSIY
jgi:hypothetical protein